MGERRLDPCYLGYAEIGHLACKRGVESLGYDELTIFNAESVDKSLPGLTCVESILLGGFLYYEVGVNAHAFTMRYGI